MSPWQVGARKVAVSAVVILVALLAGYALDLLAPGVSGAVVFAP